MQRLSFSKNSWHFRFMCFITHSYKYSPPQDLCSYTRAFLGCVMQFIVNFVAITTGVLLISLPFGFLGHSIIADRFSNMDAYLYSHIPTFLYCIFYVASGLLI